MLPSLLLLIALYLVFSINPSYRNYHHLSVNPEFSRTEHPLDLRPVCKFKPRELFLSRFYCGGPTKFKNTFFQNSEIEIFEDFRQSSRIFQKLSGDEFKSLGPHILYSSPFYRYLSLCKNRIVYFRGDYNCFENTSG